MQVDSFDFDFTLSVSEIPVVGLTVDSAGHICGYSFAIASDCLPNATRSSHENGEMIPVDMLEFRFNSAFIVSICIAEDDLRLCEPCSSVSSA